MYFTQDDYEKILGYILDHSKKDSEFVNAQDISGEELISIIQDGINKNLSLGSLIHLVDQHGITLRVKQASGHSIYDVMSQDAVTNAIATEAARLDRKIDTYIPIPDAASVIVDGTTLKITTNE